MLLASTAGGAGVVAHPAAAKARRLVAPPISERLLMAVGEVIVIWWSGSVRTVGMSQGDTLPRLEAVLDVRAR